MDTFNDDLIEYKNDGKEKSLSHTARIELMSDKWFGYYELYCEGHGATPEEAKSNLIGQIQIMLFELFNSQ